MKDLLIKNNDLIPVDYILYELNKISKIWSIPLYGWHSFHNFIELSNIRHVNKNKFLKNIIEKIISVINTNTYLINISTKSYNSSSNFAKMISSYDNSIIHYSNTVQIETYNNGYIHSTPYTLVYYNKSLDKLMYIKDIGYITYVKKENILEFMYILLYDEKLIKHLRDIIEIHYDEELINKNEKNSEQILNYINKSPYPIKKVKNILLNLNTKDVFKEKLQMLI